MVLLEITALTLCSATEAGSAAFFIHGRCQPLWHRKGSGLVVIGEIRYVFCDVSKLNLQYRWGRFGILCPDQ